LSVIGVEHWQQDKLNVLLGTKFHFNRCELGEYVFITTWVLGCLEKIKHGSHDA